MPLRTIALMTAFSPGQWPPPVRTPIRTGVTIIDPGDLPAPPPGPARVRRARERLPGRRRRARAGRHDPRERAGPVLEPTDGGPLGGDRPGRGGRSAPG